MGITCTNDGFFGLLKQNHCEYSTLPITMRTLTTRKTLIGVDLVADCFGATLLLRSAVWKNTIRYHCLPVGGVTARSTAPLFSGSDHAPNPGQNGGVVWVSHATGTVIMAAFLPRRAMCARSMVALQNFPRRHLIAPSSRLLCSQPLVKVPARDSALTAH
jgi:hypothetical protein